MPRFGTKLIFSVATGMRSIFFKESLVVRAPWSQDFSQARRPRMGRQTKRYEFHGSTPPAGQDKALNSANNLSVLAFLVRYETARFRRNLRFSNQDEAQMAL